MIVAAGATGLLAVAGLGIIAPAPTHATESLTPVSLAASISPIEVEMASLYPLPTWCPFGTHGGKGKGCRGGSINDNERLNESVDDTLHMYKDAGECAGKGVVEGKANFWSSQIAAAKCGTTKPEGKLPW
jgi:hypothetical protein